MVDYMAVEGKLWVQTCDVVLVKALGETYQAGSGSLEGFVEVS